VELLPEINSVILKGTVLEIPINLQDLKAENPSRNRGDGGGGGSCSSSSNKSSSSSNKSSSSSSNSSSSI